VCLVCENELGSTIMIAVLSDTVIMFFFCLWDWSLNSDLHTWKASILLLEPYLQSILLWLFWRWGLVSYFSGCSQTSVLPISASQVARITAMSHQCLAICYNIFIYYLFFVALELELRASCLLGRCSSTWATLPALFVLVFFFLLVLGFVLRTSYLLGRHSTTWVTSPALCWIFLG
jgi:hypothetical protein